MHDILFKHDLHPTPIGEPPERPTCTGAEKDSQPKPRNKACEKIMGGGRTEGVKDEDEWQRAGTEDHTCMAQGPGVAAAWTGMEEEHGHISCCTIVFIFLFAGRSFKFPTFRQYY